jgi:hypothetical protein
VHHRIFVFKFYSLQEDIIQYITHDAIDKKAYDACIEASTHSLIYARSFYLNHMATHWDVLVYNSYRAVMPLPWRKKMGIRYLYQPAFMQQLGIFSDKVLAPSIQQAFVNTARKNFSFAEIFLNASQPLPTNSTTCNNFVINLDTPYETIATQFKPYLQRDIKQVEKLKLLYTSDTNIQAVIASYRTQYGSKVPQVTNKDYQNFEQLCLTANRQQQLLIRKVVQPLTAETLAMGLFLIDDRRLYNLINITLPAGRLVGANHFLLNELIKEFAEQPLVLDLEGSNINSIAWFYQKFGAVNEPYFFWKFNDLPRWLKWLK